jgi:hypothetical protein
MAGTGGRREGAGRPAGALNKATRDIKALAQQQGPAAIARLVTLGGLLPGGMHKAESEGAQIAAIKELLDRGYGKATQPLSGDPDGPPLAVDFRWADALPATLAEPAIDADETISVTFVDTTDGGEC